MSKERQSKLQKRLGVAFRRTVRSLLSDERAVIDFFLFHPPDQEGNLNVLAAVNGEEVAWELRIDCRDWQLPEDRKVADVVPPDLFRDLKQFFRASWKKTLEGLGTQHDAYLRIHDSTNSFNLRNGREVADELREDSLHQSKVKKLKKAKKPRSKRKVGKLVCPVHIGDSLSTVVDHFGAHETGKAVFGDIQLLLPKQGIDVYFDKNSKTVRLMNLYPPFSQLVDGISVGDDASDVHKKLGAPDSETHAGITVGKKKCHRRWSYANLGLVINFDYSDCVLLLQKQQPQK